MLAFAAASAAWPGKTLFTPAPEFLFAPESFAALAAAAGEPAIDPSAIAHFRFGSVRTARLVRGARNAVVLAERLAEAPASAGRHPFASGAALPAGTEKLFLYGGDPEPPRLIGGQALPASLLPPAFIDADLGDAPPARAGKERGAEGDLGVVAFSEFRSALWARGQPTRLSPGLRAARDAGCRFVLLPWNIEYPGSIVPEFLSRLAALRSDAILPIVLPFNYPGQTGLIRRLIARVRDSAPDGAAALEKMFFGRLVRLAGLPRLRALAPVAWIDGNDPEHGWTVRRLRRCNIATVLLGGERELQASAHLDAREVIEVSSESRYGVIVHRSSLPAATQLADLIAMTERVPLRPIGARSRPRALA